MQTIELARLVNIAKNFGGVAALRQVSLSVHSGEVLAILGENGAGKSTLMKILAGQYPAGTFNGDIFLNGQPAALRSPRDAERAGIAIIHQELAGFAHLTVAENLFVGHWPKRNGFVDWSELRKRANELMQRFGFAVDLDAPMQSLSVGAQQMLEIIKALMSDARILILDEPTSALSNQEVETLFSAIETLRTEGRGLIYISHKMDEIERLANRVVVLRDGETVCECQWGELTREQLIEKMVGRPLDRLFPERPRARKLGDEVLSVRNWSAQTSSGRRLFGPVQFTLRAGEILGFGGLMGAGRTEIVHSLFGDAKMITTGELKFRGEAVRFSSPREAWRHGLALISENRKDESLFSERSIDENTSLARLSLSSLAKLIQPDVERKRSAERLQQVRTKFHSSDQKVTELSGGNQQKVVIARVLETLPQVILFDEPTRGIDVGAKFEIYELIFALAEQGCAILLVSSDLPELMAISDRILVIRHGLTAAEFSTQPFSNTEIMRAAL